MAGMRVVHMQKVGGISGSERHLLGLVPALRRRGWDARFVVFHEHDEDAEFSDALQRTGVPVDRIRLRGDADPLAWLRLARLLARLSPHLVHTHLVHADFYGLTAAAAARVPARVSTKHGFDDFRHRRPFAALDRAVARLAHRHIAVSDGLAEYLASVEGFSREDFVVVHYGIGGGSEAAPTATAQPAIVCVGRLIPVKGHRTLLEAFAAARRRLPQLTLEVVGEGTARAELERYAHELDLDGAARFTGRAWPVEPALERGAIVVVPSLGEGFGRVALEAMERARPVIASRVGGLAEVVEDGVTGVLVPPGEAQPLADAIVRLASDPALAARMGAAGRRRASELFSEDLCVDRTEAIYHAALARPSAISLRLRRVRGRA